jgi:ribosomal-protein-alanine N-acetyltransferase
MSEPAFRQRFAETGFWEKTEGMLLILTPADEIVGHIEPLRR